MDESAELEQTKELWSTEELTDQCIVYRHVHFFNRDKDGKKRRRYPNEHHFDLRDGEAGLSFNWNRYVDDKKCYLLIGITYGRNGEYLTLSHYKLFKYPVAFLKSLTGVLKIQHTPVVHQEYPSPVGLPNNKSHVELEYNPDDLSVRTNLSDYCNREIEYAYSTFDPQSVNAELEELRSRLNHTPYHKDWVFE